VKKVGFERRSQWLAEFLRQQRDKQTNPIDRAAHEQAIQELLAMTYDFEERLKHSVKTWGGKYGFLPSGVIDYLEDDFEDRFSFDDRDKKSDE
jgi:hypothetical protein